MRTLPQFLTALVVASICSVATAQISGPVPLAWRWAGSTSTSPVGAPLVEGDNVYVAVGSRVYCLDRESGNKKWQYPLIDPIDGNFASNLSIVDGVLYAPASNKTLYAIDPAKGEMKWSYVAPGAIVGKPSFAGKQIVLNIDANSFIAVNSDSGEAVFQNPERIFDGIRGDVFTINTDVYYFTGRLELYRTNVSTRKAERITRFQTLPTVPAPVVYGTNLYVTTGSVVVCMSPGGTPRWQRNLQDPLLFGPAASPEGVVAVSEDGIVHVLDVNGGVKTTRVNNRSQSMQIDLGSRPIAAPAAVGKLFAIPTANGALNLVDPVAGTLIWSYTIKPITAGLKNASTNNSGGTSGVNRGDELISIPAVGPAVVSGNTLMILVADGSLLAFDKDNGVDLTGPDVRTIWPQAGLQVGTTKGLLDIYMQVSDEATGINDKTLKVTVNGKEIQHQFGRDGILSLQFGQGTKNGSLPNGRAVIEVTVSDWMGNETKTKINYTIDNDLPPMARPGGRPGDQGAGPGRGLPGRGGAGGAGGLGGGNR